MPTFLRMTLTEIDDLLQEQRINNRLNMLNNAYYISCMVMNEKMLDTYNDIHREILGESNLERLKNDIKRYKMASKRLGLKYPGERVN